MEKLNIKNDKSTLILFCIAFVLYVFTQTLIYEHEYSKIKEGLNYSTNGLYSSERARNTKSVLTVREDRSSLALSGVNLKYVRTLGNLQADSKGK